MKYVMLTRTGKRWFLTPIKSITNSIKDKAICIWEMGPNINPPQIAHCCTKDPEKQRNYTALLLAAIENQIKQLNLKTNGSNPASKQ